MSGEPFRPGGIVPPPFVIGFDPALPDERWTALGATDDGLVVIPDESAELRELMGGRSELTVIPAAAPLWQYSATEVIGAGPRHSVRLTFRPVVDIVPIPRRRRGESRATFAARRRMRTALRRRLRRAGRPLIRALAPHEMFIPAVRVEQVRSGAGVFFTVIGGVE